MSYFDQLQHEINEQLDLLAAEGKPWNATWIAHAICSVHSPGLSESEHSNFWQHCGYSDTRREVTRCINRRAGDNAHEPTEQLILPGYEHLHQYYTVNRGGEEVGVHVSTMTVDELRGKAELYRSMGATCFAHARELDRYADGQAVA